MDAYPLTPFPFRQPDLAAMDRAEVTYTDLYESFDLAAFQEEYLALQAREAEGTPETET